ncbi:MAG: hypothetical protein RL198_164 [Actinomycetota bacterium]|jgi:hypothetical protein
MSNSRSVGSAVSWAFAAPVIGGATAIIIGLAIVDIFDTVQPWVWVIIQSLLFAAVWFGANQAAKAVIVGKSINQPSGAAGPARVLNYVISIVWMIWVFMLSFGFAQEAVWKSVKESGYQWWSMPEPYFNAVALTEQFIPAVLLLLISMGGFVALLLQFARDSE